MMVETEGEVRLDRWLFAARFYKTRSQAAAACDGGKVKVNGSSAKPHKLIRPGDRLTLHHHDRYRNLDVLGLSERGLPPAVARTLYHEDIKPVSKETEELMAAFRLAEKKNKPKFPGRPTKKNRRVWDRLKNGWIDG
jgi:ribosome-associated heat shock protein Hsp15